MFNFFKKKKRVSEENQDTSDEDSSHETKNGGKNSEADESPQEEDSNQESKSKDDSKKDSSDKDDANRDSKSKDDSNQDSESKDDSNQDSKSKDDSKEDSLSSVTEKNTKENKEPGKSKSFDQKLSEIEAGQSSSSKDLDVEKCASVPFRKPVKVRSVATETDLIQDEPADTEYTFDQAIEKCGYGKFQKMLTVLVGICWFADACEVLILSVLDGYIACDFDIYRWQDALLSSSLFIGMIVGGPVFGYIADVYGRRITITTSMGLCFIFGALSGAVSNWGWLLAARIIVGVSLGSLAQGVTLCIEYYPVEFRGIAGFYINYYWSFGNLSLAVLCYIVLEHTKHWRWTLSLVSLPALLVTILTYWYPESVRYYLVTQQYEKAVSQVEKMAAVNNAELPPGKLQEKMDKEAKGSILDLLKPPNTTSTLIFWYIWFAIAFHYYGLAFMTPLIIRQGRVILPPKEAAQSFGNANSTAEFFASLLPCSQLSAKNFFDLMWTGVAELPGMWIYSLMVQYFARKNLLSVALIVNAVMILFLLINFPGAVIEKILIFILRGNAGGIFQLAMVMTSEVFPTTLRAISMGSSHAFSMLGAALVPFAAQVLIIDHPIMAICIMSGVIVVAAFAATLLPREMKNVSIKDFTEDYKQVEIETRSKSSILNIIKM